MKKLGDISYFHSGLQLSRAQNQQGANNISYKIIKISDFTHLETLDLCNTEKITLSKSIPINNLTQEGDVLVRLKAPLSAVYITKEYAGYVFSSVMAAIKPNQKILLPQYLVYYLNSSIPKGYLKECNSNGTTMSFLRLSDLKELKIFTPSIEKQKKIIQFIQESNKKIALLKEKINAEISLKNERFKQLITKEAKL